MTLNASGPISLGGATVGQSINLELGQAATATASINATNFRTLAGVASGQISLSNFYGKSNTIGWFASFGVSSAETPVYGVATNSSAQVYLRLNSNVANSDKSLIQISTTGSITYQRNAYTGASSGRYSVNVDSSNNFYVYGYFSTTKIPQITKYNSSNTFQWSTRWSEDDATAGGLNNSKPVIDSSGNVFVMFMGANAGCCASVYYITIRKINSSGTLISTSTAYISGSAIDVCTPAGLGLDSSGNIYAVCLGNTVRSATFIAKLNSSFVTQSRVNYYNSTGPSNLSPNGFVFDTANNVGYVVGSTGSVGTILKINTSLSVVWCYSTSDTGYWSDCAVDSSGNLYAVSIFTVAATGIRAVKIIKLNSSGSLQWARYLRCTTLNLNTTGVSISVSGTTLTVAAQLSNGTTAQNRGFVFQVSTNGAGGAGSGTTFTNNARSWTYASYTETLTSITTIQNGSLGSIENFYSSSPTSVTPTLVTSAYTADTTNI